MTLFLFELDTHIMTNDIIFSPFKLNPNWVEDIRQSKELPLYKSEDANVAYTDEILP